MGLCNTWFFFLFSYCFGFRVSCSRFPEFLIFVCCRHSYAIFIHPVFFVLKSPKLHSTPGVFPSSWFISYSPFIFHFLYWNFYLEIGVELDQAKERWWLLFSSCSIHVKRAFPSVYVYIRKSKRDTYLTICRHACRLRFTKLLTHDHHENYLKIYVVCFYLVLKSEVWLKAGLSHSYVDFLWEYEWYNLIEKVI